MPPRGVVCGGGTKTFGRASPRPPPHFQHFRLYELGASHLEDCMLRNAIRNGRLLLLAGCAAAILAGAGALRADLMVSHGFAKVLGRARRTFALRGGGLRWIATHGAGGRRRLLADTRRGRKSGALCQATRRRRSHNHFRAGRPRARSGGDRLKAIGEPLTKAVTGTTPMRLLLVTCRIVDGSERETHAPVRFIIEGDPAEAPPVQPSVAPKAL